MFDSLRFPSVVRVVLLAFVACFGVAGCEHETALEPDAVDSDLPNTMEQVLASLERNRIHAERRVDELAIELQSMRVAQIEHVHASYKMMMGPSWREGDVLPMVRLSDTPGLSDTPEMVRLQDEMREYSAHEREYSRKITLVRHIIEERDGAAR